MQTSLPDAMPGRPDAGAGDTIDSDPLPIGYESAMPWLHAPLPADRPALAPPPPASAAG